MKLPDSLKGEVKKIEYEVLDWIKTFDDEQVDEELDWLEMELIGFYRQNFKPEMIEYFEDVYFEGPGSRICRLDCGDYAIDLPFIVYDKEGELHSNVTTSFTLSDFIDACINSDIKLRWKK